MWIRHHQVYRSILLYHSGLIHNRGNLKHATRGCEIKDGLRLSLREVRDRLKICKDKCKYFCRHGHRYWQKYLNNHLVSAQERHNEEAKPRILAIMQREKYCLYWRRLNYSMPKAKGRSIRVVQTSTFDELVT